MEIKGKIYINNNSKNAIPLLVDTNSLVVTSASTVGIGTTVPTGKLSIESAGGTILRLKNTAGSGSSIEVVDSSNVTQLSIGADNSYQLGFYAGINGPLYFGTFGQPASGRGGFSRPGSVIAGFSANNSRMGLGGGVHFVLNDPSALMHIKGEGSTSSTTALLVQNSSNSDLLTIRDDGNVGIGTPSPTAKLHVAGNGSKILFDGGDGDIKYIMNDVTSGGPGTNGSPLQVEAGETQSIGGTGGSISIKGGLGTLGIGGNTYIDGGVGSSGADGDVYLAHNTTGIVYVDGSPQNGGTKFVVNTPNGYDQIRLVQTYTPTNNTDTNGEPGSITWDENYVYFKTSANGWGRIPLDFVF